MYQQAKIKFQLILNLALVSLVVINIECASITGSKNQLVSINTICEGVPIGEASSSLMNDKDSSYVNTPGSVMIQKSYGDLTVSYMKSDPLASDKFKSKSNGGVWGNLIGGEIVGSAAAEKSGSGLDIHRI